MKILLAALALCAAFSGAASAATVTNGSFEGPGTFTGTFQTIGAGSGALTGWTVNSGNIDLIRTYWASAAGNYSLDMTGNRAGTISQTVTGLIAGRNYILSFAMAGNPDRAGAKILTASVGATSQVFSFDSTGKTRNAMGWTTMTMGFTAAASSQILRFVSGSSGVHGAALDDVKIDLAPVPLPAAGALLLAGLGGLALLRRRKA
jgi:choice-of-anchor C domain-containing protein